MCIFKRPRDNSSRMIADAEAQRQARIAQGMAAINNQFSQFNDDFFSGISRDALAYYNPQLTEQFQDASRDLALNLARAGLSDSSIAARRSADLNRAFTERQGRLVEEADNIARRARKDVENARSAVISDLNASADPVAAQMAAAARVRQLSAPPTFDPLENVFSAALRFAGTGAAAERMGGQGFGGVFYNQNGQSRIGNALSGLGSGRTVS